MHPTLSSIVISFRFTILHDQIHDSISLAATWPAMVLRKSIRNSKFLLRCYHQCRGKSTSRYIISNVSTLPPLLQFAVRTYYEDGIIQKFNFGAPPPPLTLYWGRGREKLPNTKYSIFLIILKNYLMLSYTWLWITSTL